MKDFLFGFNDGWTRKHWENKPFRKLYRRTKTALSLRHGEVNYGEVFSSLFQEYLFEHHWILPYPCSEVFMQTTKQGQRMWYSIRRERMGWKWARKEAQGGRCRRIPAYMSWSHEEWIWWMMRQRGVLREEDEED